MYKVPSLPFLSSTFFIFPLHVGFVLDHLIRLILIFYMEYIYIYIYISLNSLAGYCLFPPCDIFLQVRDELEPHLCSENWRRCHCSVIKLLTCMPIMPLTLFKQENPSLVKGNKHTHTYTQDICCNQETRL